MIQLNGKQINPTRFPDGTSQVWKLEDLPDDARIDWRYAGDFEIMQVLQLVDLLKSGRYRKVTLNIHYLPYARQDKRICNELTFGMHTFWKVLCEFPIDFCQIFDPHCNFDEADIGYNPLKVRFISPDIDMLAAQYDSVCFPDAGAAKRYRTSKPVIVGEKVRDQSTGKITHYSISGDVNADDRVLVVDDICDGGATFVMLGQSIKSLNVGLYVSHGIFSRGQDGVNYLREYYDEIITTDSYGRLDRNLTGIKILKSPLQ